MWQHVLFWESITSVSYTTELSWRDPIKLYINIFPSRKMALSTSWVIWAHKYFLFCSCECWGFCCHGYKWELNFGVSLQGGPRLMSVLVTFHLLKYIYLLSRMKFRNSWQWGMTQLRTSFRQTDHKAENGACWDCRMLDSFPKPGHDSSPQKVCYP